jgi:hypothetical protein
MRVQLSARVEIGSRCCPRIVSVPRQCNAAAPTGRYPSAHKRLSVSRAPYLRALPISVNTVLTFVPTV